MRLRLVVLVAAVMAAVPAVALEHDQLRVDTVATEGHPRVELAVTLTGVPPEQAGEVWFSLLEGGELRDVSVDERHGLTRDVVLVLDVSGSMAGHALDTANSAAAEFIRRAPEELRIALVSFSTDVVVHSGPTEHRDELVQQIEGLRAGGRTALYDAVLVAVDLVDGRQQGATVIVLADGEDNASEASLDDVRHRLEQAEVTVHAIELQTAVSDREALEQLASPTGGITLTASTPDELDRVYRAIADHLGVAFALTYVSEASGSTRLDLTAHHGERSWHGEVLVDLPAPTVDVAPVVEPSPPPPSGPATVREASAVYLLGGLLFVYAALAVLVVTLLPRRPRVAADRRGGMRRVAGPFDGAVVAAEAALRKGVGFERIERALDRAGLDITPGRFVVRTVLLVLIALVGGITLVGWWLGILLALVSVVAVRSVLSVRTSRRRAKFADQLDDTLQLLGASLRAGHSLLQAVDTVAREAEEPTAGEFRRILNATRVGQDLSSAMDETVERTASPDFSWIAQAIAIHREVGGNLANVLDSVAETIRERTQIRRQVSALSAEGRLSAIVLIALPVGIAMFLTVVNPGYLVRFVTEPAGVVMLLTAIGLLLVGGLWLRRLVRVRF